MPPSGSASFGRRHSAPPPLRGEGLRPAYVRLTRHAGPTLAKLCGTLRLKPHPEPPVKSSSIALGIVLFWSLACASAKDKSDEVGDDNDSNEDPADPVSSCLEYLDVIYACFDQAYDDVDPYDEDVCYEYAALTGTEAEEAERQLECLADLYANADCSSPEALEAINPDDCLS